MSEIWKSSVLQLVANAAIFILAAAIPHLWQCGYHMVSALALLLIGDTWVSRIIEAIREAK